MKQVLQHVRSGRLEVADVPEPAGRAGAVTVRNVASLISAGTEKLMISFAGKSVIGKARERPDLVKQVMDKVKKDGLMPTVQTVMARLDQPLPLGYSCAGTVESVGRGAEEFAVGDRVACAGAGYASHADVVCVPRNLVVRVPDNVSMEDAAYVTVGAIALQGIRVADLRLGESVAVIGLGLLGQLTTQILKAGGCRVVGIDIDDAKLSLARELGADIAVARSDDVGSAVANFTGGTGVDAVIITAATESNDPIELAGEICRDRGVVSMVGAVKMDIPRKAFYEKELQLRLSRSYGPGRYDTQYEEKGIDYPIGYVRWTERRNMEEFLRLVSLGYVTPERLTTHRYPIEEAERAYALVKGEDRQPFVGVLLKYGGSTTTGSNRSVQLRPRVVQADKVGVGFVGAGNFAKAVLLPRFRAARDATLIAVCTGSGMNAKSTGERFGFNYCTTDAGQLLRDPSIDAVVIATRHGSHARFAADFLRAGKAVFVEKPLALNPAELQEVLEAHAESGQVLTVGFNRRFSPLVATMKEFFATGQPLAIQYRINAGAIPGDSWVHDTQDGGGRIVGEVCHFIDLVQYMTDDDLVEVFAYSLGGTSAALMDTVTISLKYRGGSIASINYFSTGDKSVPKEMVEVYGGGGIAVLTDFRELTLTRDGRKKRIRRASQEKGFDEEVVAFLRSVRLGGDAPIPLTSLVATTRATFAITDALRTGRPVIVA